MDSTFFPMNKIPPQIITYTETILEELKNHLIFNQKEYIKQKRFIMETEEIINQTINKIKELEEFLND